MRKGRAKEIAHCPGESQVLGLLPVRNHPAIYSFTYSVATRLALNSEQLVSLSGCVKDRRRRGGRGTGVRAHLRTPHGVSPLSSSFALLCLSEVGVADVLTMCLLCVHIPAATLGLRATSVKMAKVNTQCSQPSPTRCSVKTTDRDLDHVETSLGR